MSDVERRPMSGTTEGGIDWEMFAVALAELRESFRAQVAGLIEDGFTDREARQIIVGLWRAAGLAGEEES